MIQESLSPNRKEKLSPQRKTTLKWSRDGELSPVDMTRILNRLSKAELTECDLACTLDKSDDNPDRTN